MQNIALLSSTFNHPNSFSESYFSLNRRNFFGGVLAENINGCFLEVIALPASLSDAILGMREVS